MRTSATALLALGCVLCVAGCGIGPGAAPSAVRLLVTQDFGAHVLRETPRPKVNGQETVMSLLLRNETATTRYGGAFVQSIDGLSGTHTDSGPVDWFYYVNGVEAGKGAAATNVHPGDHIWWDRHDWSQTNDVPAVVGSFPEPFLNGLEGKRFPVRVECSTDAGAACGAVTRSLQDVGVPAATSALGSGGGEAILRVLVGTWAALRADGGVAQIERGPRASGVYATFGASGKSLRLLDPDGRIVQTANAGAGLIAATKRGKEAPAWVVTGTDVAGVQRAAGDFAEPELRDHFALAVLPNGAVPVPVIASAAPGGENG
jgi:hypothetical protein